MSQRVLPDINFWLALSLEDHLLHKQCMNEFICFGYEGSFLFNRITQAGLLRLLTNQTITKALTGKTLTNQQALKVYKGWTSRSNVGFASEPAGLEKTWYTLAERRTSSPKLWMDAYLAAFALQGGYTLLTCDNAFRQFKEVEQLLIH